MYSLVFQDQYLCYLISGLCSGGERCSVSQPATSTTNQDVLYAQDSTAGICVKPKAGGAGCSSGAGMACKFKLLLSQLKKTVMMCLVQAYVQSIS